MRRALFVLMAMMIASAGLAATITVLVQETALRKRAASYAPSVGTARLGQKFESSGEENGFHKTPSGYIHASAVTTRKSNVSSGGVGGAATADEVTLAGKGFNAQVEKTYGANNASANFKAVDAMERRSVSESAVMEFLRSGGLLAEGGSK